MELRPIWELVSQVDEAKGDALQMYLTDKWAREAGEFNPTRFFLPSPTLANSKIYVMGGYNSDDGYLQTAEVYDMSTGTWSAIAPMGTARGGLAAVTTP